MAGGTVCLGEKKDLADKRDPSGPDERVERYEHEIPDEISDRDDEIYPEKLFLFVVSDEEVGEEGREEIEKKYEHHDPHRIERSVDVFRVFDILSACDEAYDIGAIYEKKTGDSYPKYQENLVGFCDVYKQSLLIYLFDRLRKKREHGVQKYGSEHHPNLDYLHGNRIERDGGIGHGARLQNGEEYDIYLEVEYIKEERKTVGKRSCKDMLGIGPVESETYRNYFPGIEIEHDGHDDVSEKSRNHDPREHGRIGVLTESLIKPDAFREEDVYYEHHRKEIHNLPDSSGHERELCLQKRLKHGHDR